MPRPQFGFPIQYVQDVETAKRFYVDVLGLTVQRDHPMFVQFDHFAIAGDEALGGTREPELYWLVDDAEAAYRELASRARVTMELRELPFGKVFAVADVDGHPCFLVQLARDRPSRAV